MQGNSVQTNLISHYEHKKTTFWGEGCLGEVIHYLLTLTLS